MEHSCYRCHAEIPEGVTFCPHCGAPQIRVTAPEGSAELPPPPTSPDAAGQAAPPVPATPPAYWTQSAQYPAQPGAIQWSAAWKGALVAGLAAAVLSVIPIVSMGCLLWMLGAGALSVALYRKQVPGTVVTSGMGMKLGALAGLFGWIANAAVMTASFVLLRSSDTFRQAMQEQMQRQMAGNQDPKVQQMMQNLLDWMSTPQGAASMIVLVVLVFGAIFLVLTAAGGALGASIFGSRRDPR